MAMDDSNYTPISQDFTSGNLIYSPKQWTDNELIERIEMNNIEQGIQIALKQTDDIRTTSETAINNMRNYYTNTILPSLNSFNTRMDGLSDEIAGYVEDDLYTNNSNIVTTLQQLIGVTDYNIQSLPYSRPNGVKAIDTRITELYDEVFGTGSSGSTSSTSLNARIQALTTSVDNLPTTIYDTIGARLGSAYYNSSNHSWAGTYTDDIDSRITTLYNAIFGQSSSGSNKTILEQIEALNTALFGSSSGGTFSGPLIDKVEKAMGRSLNLENGETADATTGEYSNSLSAQINEIKGVLGLDGATSSSSSSSLVADVNTLLDLVYGYTIENNERVRNSVPLLTTALQNSYIQLYTDFYLGNTGSISTLVANLTSAQTDTSQALSALNTTVNGYSDQLEDLEGAYRDADIHVYGDNAYLILKYDTEEEDAENTEEIANKNNKYLQLPLMGGGGGAAYELDASFINRDFPINNTITVGNAYNIGFTWKVTQDESDVSLDGILTIRLNGTVVDTLYIMSNTPLTYNLGQYISSSGRNVFTITASNAAVPSRTLYTTVVAYNAILESSFDPSVVQTGSSISYTYTASIGSGSIEKVLHISIDGTELTLNGNISLTESARTISFTTPPAGDHLIVVWFTANVGTIENPNIIYSNTITYGILSGTSIDTRIATNFSQTTIDQYDTLTINYLVVTPNQETTRVEFYFGDTISPIIEEVNATYQRIDYPVTQPGGIMTIRIVAGSAEKILTVNVITNINYDFSPVDAQLQASFTPGSKTNASIDRNIWLNEVESPASGYENITGQLENFLFYNTNNFDGWLRDENGQSFLRLRNRDKVTINLPIFNFNINANNQITDGMTFEVDFKTSDVTNYATEIIACYEEGFKNAKNLIFTAQDATLNNSASLQTQFKEEERLTITFVVENSSSGPLYQLFKVYINGILSGAVQYESTALNFTAPNNGKIVLGSDECTLDIYSIRFYNRALTFPEVIKNWIANLGTYNEKITNYNKNNYKDSNGRITYTAFQAASPTTPYMVITGEGDWNDEDGLHAMPTTKSAGTFSTSDKGIKVVYTDPVNPSKSFTTDFEGGEVGVAIQGTSSQEYKRKNYKIKLTNFMQNGILHKKKLSASDYEEDGVTLKENIIKEGYKLTESSLPTYTFCIKADVASSESANNTELVNMYDTIVRQVELTPPQGDDPKIREGVEGYPMVTWYYNNRTKEYIFLGKYNFNNDKSTEDVYGFEDGDESWEFGNNEKLLCFFDESEDPTWENWRTAFETRFPDDDSSMTKEEDAYTDAQIANRLAGLRELIHWVSDSVSWTNSDKEAVTFNNTPTQADITLAASTGRTPELEAFRREFKNYFNLDLITFFFVYTEFFLMVDNRAKNMFMTRYKVNASRPKNPDWHAAYGDNIVELAASTSTRDTYAGWFSLPYDMDTSIGINNVGVYKFNYGYETGDYQPDGSVVFNGQKSKLWVAFTQAFPNEIRNMYITFSNNMSYTAVENIFEQHQGVWSETVVNEDMISKYIDWITTYDSNNNPLTRDTRALPMLLGLKTQQRKWWLENRFIYFNSKYAIEANTDAISLGVRKAQLNIPVSVYADAYVTFKVGAQDISPTTIRVKIGETKTITRDTSQESGAGDRVESTLSPASRIRSVENLADLQLNNADFSRATKLQILRIGSATQENSRLTSINLSGNTLLHLFDLRNCTGYTNDLSVANCLSLENLYLAGTKIKNVILPAGGILKTIQYPTTIENITIINQPYLTNLIIGDSLPADEIQTSENNIVSIFNGINNYSNITALYLDNAGQVDSLSIVQAMPNNGNLYLTDINWTMTTAEFMILFNKLKDMKGFIGTQPSSDERSYLGGTLYLTTLPDDTDIETIGARFGNLKLYYQDEQGENHEYFSVKFFDNFNYYNLENSLIKTQYVPAGQGATFNSAAYFTEDYLLAYNRYLNASWEWGVSETRQAFYDWDISLINIQTDLEVHPIMQTQYRVDYVLQKRELGQYQTIYRYYFPNTQIENIDISNYTFERDYYRYRVASWTEDSNQQADCIQTGDNRPDITDRTKTATTQTWYAVYTRSPEIYEVKVYNTDVTGEKQGEALLTLQRAIVSGGISTIVLPSDISGMLPINNQNIFMVGSDADGIEDNIKTDENRTYRFLNTKPYIPSSGLRVTGNMEILITYYKKDDLFTNYFLNKLTNCDLGSITVLPEAAFFHNTNLVRLKTQATTIGNYAFAGTNSSNNNRKIYIFTGTNIDLGKFCFHSIKNAIIVFTGTGIVTIHNYGFNDMRNSNIIMLNSNYPIVIAEDRNSGFSNFISGNNWLYVKDDVVRNLYPNSINSSSTYQVPYNLIESERSHILRISDNSATYQALMEEVGTI